MMARTHFTREMQRLQDEMIMLGSMVAEAIQDAVRSLRERDLEAAKRLIKYDRTLNARRFEIERDSLVLLATQQPMAGDLRLIAAILEISMELERMGDYAKGIARITLMLGLEPIVRPFPEIQMMADAGTDMMRRALDAFVNRDLEAAKLIPTEDDQIDAMYNKVNRELITTMMAHPDRSDQANYMSWAAHNLERFADRVTNICERIMYTITGEFMEFDAEEPGSSGTN